MSTITDIAEGNKFKDTYEVINTNFDNLNTDKAEVTGQVFTGPVSFSGTTNSGLKVNSLTTTQRNALTAANGMVIYNTTTSNFEMYENGGWISMASSQYITLTYGETIAVNDAVYLKAADGYAYKADADAEATCGTFIGFAKDAGNLGASGRIQISGKVTGLSGLTAGSFYYLSGTAGALSATTVGIGVQAGFALSTTELVIQIARSPQKFTGGLITRDISAANGAVTTAHGLGRVPKYVRISMYLAIGTGAVVTSVGEFDGTTAKFVASKLVAATWSVDTGSGGQTEIVRLYADSTNSVVATIGIDVTNITLTWTKTNSPTGTANILWEAYG
jgi:hypothetical protein